LFGGQVALFYDWAWFETNSDGSITFHSRFGSREEELVELAEKVVTATGLEVVVK
jgi:hypothetical protein